MVRERRGEAEGSRRSFKKEGNNHSVICYGEISTEDLSDFGDFGDFGLLT